jgi:hypothetical protein
VNRSVLYLFELSIFFLKKYLAQNFVVNFVAELQLVHEQLRHTVSSSIPVLPFDVLRETYSNCTGRRIFFLDHDGTLLAHPSFSKLKAGGAASTNTHTALSSSESSSSSTSAHSPGMSSSAVGMARSKSMGSSLNSWRSPPSSGGSVAMGGGGGGGGIEMSNLSNFSVEEQIIALLKQFLADESNIVYLVSGRKRDDLSAFFDVPGLGLR